MQSIFISARSASTSRAAHARANASGVARRLNAVTDVSGSLISRQRCCEGEAFVDPAGDAADHHLNGQAQPGQTHGRLAGTVAMRPR